MLPSSDGEGNALYLNRVLSSSLKSEKLKLCFILLYEVIELIKKIDGTTDS